MGSDQPALDSLIESYQDRYELPELIEHLGVTYADILEWLEEWMLANPDAIQEDLETITNFGDTNE